MTDLEILGELKKSYEYLNDIIDNADNTQMQSTKELCEVQNILEKKYVEVYKKIKETNDISLYYEEDIMIGSSIYIDYEDIKGYGITYNDIANESKWWEDYQFLTNFLKKGEKIICLNYMGKIKPQNC